MKLFFLGLFLIFCSPSFSQVCIKPESARYFLEADDERWILREKDTLQTKLITTLTTELLVKDQIIATYKSDSSTYAFRETTFNSQIRLIEQDNDNLRKDLRKQKLLRNLAILGIIIAAIL